MIKLWGSKKETAETKPAEAAPAPAPVPEPATQPAPEAPAAAGGWLSRLREGLAKSSSKLAEGIGSIFVSRRLDDATLEELEDLLISADLGPVTAAYLTQALAQNRFGKMMTGDEVRGILADDIAALLESVAEPLVPDPTLKPHVVLVVGVNGTGKTTTIGKLARQWRDEGRSVMLAAGDTFRAAAVAQLKIWG